MKRPSITILTRLTPRATGGTGMPPIWMRASAWGHARRGIEGRGSLHGGSPAHISPMSSSQPTLRRSGRARASCYSSQPDMSILGPEAIAWLLLIEVFGRNSMRITRWPSHLTAPRASASGSNTTQADATSPRTRRGGSRLLICVVAQACRHPRKEGNACCLHDSGSGSLDCLRRPRSPPNERRRM